MPAAWRPSLASSFRTCRGSAAAPTATTRPPSACRPSTGLASTAPALTPCTNTASSRRSCRACGSWSGCSRRSHDLLAEAPPRLPEQNLQPGSGRCRLRRRAHSGHNEAQLCQVSAQKVSRWGTVLHLCRIQAGLLCRTGGDAEELDRLDLNAAVRFREALDACIT